MVIRRTSRVIRSRRPKRKVVFARYQTSGSNIPAATVQTFLPLADFETAYGAQLLGATVVGIRGWGSARNRGSVTTSFQTFSYGLIVDRNDLADLSAGHPNPSFVTTNNDRMSSWMWIEEIPLAPALSTPVSGQSTQDNYTWSFQTRNKRKLAQLEDNLVLAIATGATSTVDFAISLSVAVALS